MKKLEQLIAQVSSYSVAYIELGAVASVKTGDQLNREGLTSSGDYPVINGGIAPSGYHDEFNTSGPVTVISQGGASAGYVNWMPGAIWAGAHCFTIKPNEHMILSRYLYHFLKQMKLRLGLPEERLVVASRLLSQSTVQDAKFPAQRGC